MKRRVQPGDVLLGKYQVERILGRGGMGVVVAARHRELGELFAIKLMLPEVAENPEARSRFMREARASARLKGEHVVKVHDVGKLEDGTPYMLMEHLVGKDVGALLSSHGSLPLDEATPIVLEACDALAEAHTLGIVHRDLKPSNLFLVQRPDGKAFVKVLDFGIAKQSLEDLTQLTDSGTVIGSPFYMSPEQMRDPKTVDHRSDIWSLGVVLYELTTGTYPFNAETLAQFVLMVMNDEPEPPSRARTDLPLAFDAMVQRCLRKDPKERYASVGELASDLRSLLAPNSEQGASAMLASLLARAAPPRPSADEVSYTYETAPSDLGKRNADDEEIEPMVPPTPAPAGRRKATRRTASLVAVGAMAFGLGLGSWFFWSQPTPSAPPRADDMTNPSAPASPAPPPRESPPSPAPPPPTPAAAPQAEATTAPAPTATPRPTTTPRPTAPAAAKPPAPTEPAAQPPPAPAPSPAPPPAGTATSRDGLY